MTRLGEMTPQTVETTKTYLKRYAKQMLKNTIFIGSFQEKRFVEPLNSYRDVITIAQEERDFIQNLMAVKKVIERETSGLKRPWIGITEPDAVGAPSGHNLWVVLPEHFFGRCWYNVIGLEYSENDIRLKIELLRPVKDDSSVNGIDISEFDFGSFVKDVSGHIQTNLLYFYKYVLTFQNIKNSLIFVTFLTTAIIAAGFNTVHYLLEFVLKLIRATSGLIKALTPIIINLNDLVGRTVFGLYQLILLLVRGRPQPPPVYNTYFSLDSQTMPPDPRQRYDKYFPNQLPYYPNTRPRATIKPLENVR